MVTCITKTANDKLARQGKAHTHTHTERKSGTHRYKSEGSLSGKYVKLSDTISTAQDRKRLEW